MLALPLSLVPSAAVAGAVAALLTTYPPVGCVIDCSTWDGRKSTENTIWFETLDGKIFTNLCEYPIGTDPGSPRLGFKLMFNDLQYEYEMLGEYRFFVRGSKAAPLRRVRIEPVEPGGWTPTYHFVWDEPRPLAPPPRRAGR